MPRYAVILPLLGDPGPGKVLSTHDKMREAKADLPRLAGAYVARRKRGATWETQAEAQARRGTAGPAGVKPVLVGGRRVNVYLDDETIEFAEWYGREFGAKYGGGSMSEGLRLGMKLVRETVEAEREAAGRAGAEQEVAGV